MKQKSRLQRGLTVLTIHKCVFALFTLGLWLIALRDIYSDYSVSYPQVGSYLMIRFCINLAWGVLLFSHIQLDQWRLRQEARMRLTLTPLNIHKCVFALFTLGLWMAVIWHASSGYFVPYQQVGSYLTIRFCINLAWAGLLFLHMQLDLWCVRQGSQAQHSVIDKIKRDYSPSLALEAEDGNLIHEDDWIAQRRLQSK